MKKLIIAEKPSLAKNILQGINEKFEKKDGYYESSSYIVSYAFGHLFTLCDADDYDVKLKHWDLNDLPFFPKTFQFKLKQINGKTDAGIKKQFEILKKLYNRKDVESVVNAGDADREGEVIIRLILGKIGKTKPVYRLWLPDQTPQTIAANLRDMKRDEEYDNLYAEGIARMYIDWLYGINLTRLVCLKANAKDLRVGRVLTPIVSAIYERDSEIKNFVPKKYFAVQSKSDIDGVILELTSQRSFDKNEDAKRYAEILNSNKACVVDKVSKEQTVNPGKLYSLSKLQGVMGKAYKITPEQTLAAVQSLYEGGFMSYPRTNTEYLAEAEKDKVKNILNILSDKYNVKFKDNYIFNDKKIESHSALTPTAKMPDTDKLGDVEKKVYSTVLNRFLAVFCAEDCVVLNNEYKISVGGEMFKVKGRTVLNKGFMVYDSVQETKDKLLPKLNIGDSFDVDFKSVEKVTQPPKHYTVETLNNYLKNPFKKELNSDEDNDDEDYKALFKGVELGTEATRTGIIQKAINSKYIVLKNNSYQIEEKGIYLIETIKALNINFSKEKTAELGTILKSVYHSDITVDNAVKSAFDEIRDMFDCSGSIALNTNNKFSYTSNGKSDALCKCSHCASDVFENSKAYSCSGCNAVIFKDERYFNAIGKKMTKTIAKKLFTARQVHFDDLKSKRTGKTYSANIIADFSENGDIKYSMKF